MKINKIILMGLAAMLTLASCSRHEGDPAQQAGTALGVTFRGIEPATKASFADGGQTTPEKYVTHVNAYVFETQANGGKLLAFAPGAYDGTSSQYRFPLPNTLGGKSVHVVFVANDNIPASGYTIGTTTYTQFQSVTTAPYESCLVPPFVMMAETTSPVTVINDQLNSVGTISLRRLVARVDITNALTDGTVITGAQLVDAANASPIHYLGTPVTSYMDCMAFENKGYCTTHGVLGDAEADLTKMWGQLYTYPNPNTTTKPTKLIVYYTQSGTPEILEAPLYDNNGDLLTFERNTRYEVIVSDGELGTPGFTVLVKEWDEVAIDNSESGAREFHISEPLFTTLGDFTTATKAITIGAEEQVVGLKVDSETAVVITVTDAAGNAIDWIVMNNDIVNTRSDIRGDFRGMIDFSVKPNASGSSRMATVKIANERSSAVYTITQEGTVRTDALVKDYNPSNCFMAMPGTKVHFNGRIRGNEALETLTTADHVKLIWQDMPNLVKYTAYNSFTHNASVVTTPGVKGNALVAACDASGKVLWSWHIWVTDYVPTPTVAGYAPDTKWTVPGGEVHSYGAKYNVLNSNKVMMDRNLGAVKTYYTAPPVNDPEAYLSYGYYYQWGRKDPFPGFNGQSWSTWVSELNRVRTMYNAEGEEDVSWQQDGVGGFLPNVKNHVQKRSSNKADNLAFVISNPDILLNVTGGSFYIDWYAGEYDYTHAGFWGYQNGTTPNTDVQTKLAKTIYDPCPEGWRVPPGAPFTDLTVGTWGDFNRGMQTDATIAAKTALYYAEGLTPVSFTMKYYDSFTCSDMSTLGILYEAGTVKAWYPCGSYRATNQNNMTPLGINYCEMWSATTHNGLSGNQQYRKYASGFIGSIFSSGTVNNDAPANAKAVRCISE